MAYVAKANISGQHQSVANRRNNGENSAKIISIENGMA
jgi:hypothetical protein